MAAEHRAMPSRRLVALTSWRQQGHSSLAELPCWPSIILSAAVRFAGVTSTSRGHRQACCRPSAGCRASSVHFGVDLLSWCSNFRNCSSSVSGGCSARIWAQGAYSCGCGFKMICAHSWCANYVLSSILASGPVTVQPARCHLCGSALC